MNRWYLLITYFLLVSCMGTFKTYTLDTAEKDVAFWTQGYAYQSQTLDSVTLEISYNKYLDNSYVFNMRVSNGANHSVIFDPQYIQASQIDADSVLVNEVFAIDPEVKLQEIDSQIKSEKARITRNAAFGVLEGIFCVVADVSMEHTEENESKKESMWSARESMSEIHAHNINNAQVSLMNLHDWVPYWQEVALRKTTIFPEHYHEGAIHISLTYAPLVKIMVPVENRRFEFQYIMNEVKTYPH